MILELTIIRCEHIRRAMNTIYCALRAKPRPADTMTDTFQLCLKTSLTLEMFNNKMDSCKKR